jgi:general secretion pathway protein A
MYEAYYGLTDRPFQTTPDSSYYFGSRQHQRAMAYLEYGLHQSEGFIVITGDVGAGKTTLIRNLFSKLDSEKIVAASLMSTQLDADNVLRMVASAFGLPTTNVTKADLLIALDAFLGYAYRTGKRCLIVVDEAQNLSLEAVEELRMLSNFELNQHALLQSFLVGQPEFRQTLQSPRMLQLRQRVIAACHLGPLDATETRGYVEHRLTHAGWKDSPHFTEDAFPAIHATSGGIPRRINVICDRLLLSGFLSNTRTFGEAEVTEIAHEIESESFAPKLATTGTAGTPTTITEHIPAPSSEPRPAVDALTWDSFALRLNQVDDRIDRIESALDGLLRNNSSALALLSKLIDQIDNSNQTGDERGSKKKAS